MRTRDAVQPIVGISEGRMTAGSAGDVSPNSSAVVAITVLADAEDVLAVLRTAFLLARNLRAPLSVNLLGREISSGHVDDSSRELTVSELLESAGRELHELVYKRAPNFVLEASVIAASFVSAGSISVCVRSTNPGS
jgi:hypothetical protein